ncbi:MAG: zinc ABC transporter substrate-binding protein, partial [Chloroflexota bacterium]|nr:zinc ABC transporter substrate-binding protein [Chloroflexota bacterium]
VAVNATGGPAEGGLSTTEATAARAGADPGAATAATGRKLKVVATFSVLGDLVRNVGGDLIELSTLVPPGGDAHTFEPSPADGVALAVADVVFENGLQFEAWLPDLFAASGSKARRVVLSEGIELLKAPEGEDDEHADETATAGADRQAEGTATTGMDGHDEQGEWDPHVWHDVNNAVRMVEHIRDGLAAVDPANAATYRGNAASYLQQIKALDAFVVAHANTLPPERRKLVTTHDTFGYFARRYSFEIVGTPLGVTTETADPSAAEIVALVNQIKATGVPAIFTENIENSRLMERIAREAGVELAPPLFSDALGEPGSDGDTYEKMIRYNVETIMKALGK